MDAAFWNDRYAAAHYVYGETPNAFVAEMASHIPRGPVLCLAEGEGRNATAKAAVAEAESMLAYARVLAPFEGVIISLREKSGFP